MWKWRQKFFMKPEPPSTMKLSGSSQKPHLTSSEWPDFLFSSLQFLFLRENNDNK